MAGDEYVALGEKRILSILRTYSAAGMRTLEQKIADAGPFAQRIEPHHITTARQRLVASGQVLVKKSQNAEWYYRSDTPEGVVDARVRELSELHARASAYELVQRVGQALEIAVLRAFSSQQAMEFVGGFTDLEEHDDSRKYAKDEPPRVVSGRMIPGAKRLDFLATYSDARHIGIEVKNIRSWLYPNEDEIRDLLTKCCAINAVPVLIARRIPYITRSTLGAAGVVFHETYNQLYPESEAALAKLISDKRLLGYHDIRLGNEPDDRLRKFVHVNLPRILPAARARFDEHAPLLSQFAARQITWGDFEQIVRKSAGNG